MKFYLIFAAGLLSVQTVWAEFNDPMRPPAYALEKFRLQKFKKNTSGIKRVTKPAKPVTKDVWVLNSILFSGQRQHAIINNKLVKKGDMIKGGRLIQLKPDSVRLLVKGKVIELTIYDKSSEFNSIKKSLTEKKI